MVVLGSKEEFFSDLMAGMNNLRKDKTLYDVRIIVKSQEILAHKSVLTPVSDYFKSLFLGPFKTDSVIVEVDFSSVALDIESAEAILEYLYTGTIDINDDNLEAILKLSSFLLIKPLQNICIKFMEQNCDLNMYIRYFILAADYMVSEVEERVVNILKSRFHDWFVFREPAKYLSVCHLQRLAKNYDIFEHCSRIDTILFLVDWVLNGKTDEHEALACELLDFKSHKKEEVNTKMQNEDGSQCQNERLSKDEARSANTPQSKTKAQCKNETQTKEKLQSGNGTQTEDGSQTVEKEIKEGDLSQPYQRQSYDTTMKIDMMCCKLQKTNGYLQLKEKFKEIIAKYFSKDIFMVEQEDEMKTENWSQQIQESEAQNGQNIFTEVIESSVSPLIHIEQATDGSIVSQIENSSKSKQRSDDNYKELDEAKNDKQVEVDSMAENTDITDLEIQESIFIVDQDELRDRSETENNYLPASLVVQQVEVCTSEETFESLNEQIEESDSEQVLFVVTPKKLLKNADHSLLELASMEWSEKLFDIYVYIPRQKNWYYYGEGMNDGAFKKIAASSSESWSHNFCTKEYLCCASQDEPRLYMYPLECNDNRRSPSWSHVSYNHLVRNFTDFDISSDVHFCCADGETIYMVVLKKEYRSETKVKFKCYRLSTQNSWNLMFETRYLLKAEDFDMCDSIFDVQISPENREMVIAVESHSYLHVFVIDLENKQAEIKYNCLEHGPGMLEDYFPPHNALWIMMNGKRLSLVEEYLEEGVYRYYRFMELDVSEGLSIRHTGDCCVEHTLPIDYNEQTCSELIYSVCDGISAWVFLSDGKFSTSMEEIRVNRPGSLEFKQHTPPPFSAVTLMARGIVERKNLAHLKPVKEFQQE